MDPRGTKMDAQGHTKYKKNNKMYTKGANMESEMLQWSPKVPQSKKQHEKVPQSATHTPKCTPRYKKTSKRT